MTAQQEFTKLAMKQHPLSAAFPSMSDEDVLSLAEDIAKQGQREKGVLYQGMVLDGWHRYRACYLVGAEFQSQEFDGEDPRAFVISKNLHRRHLTAMQKASAVVAVHEWRQVGDPATVAGSSESEMAEEAEVSPRTIRHAKEAVRLGLGDEARAGKVTARQVADTAKLSPSKREKAVKAIKDGTPAPKEKKADPRDAEIKRLTKALEEANEGKVDLADTARELSDKLTAFETTEPDEQQKEIQKLQKKIVRLEAEIQRLTVARNDCQGKNNELIRQIKIMRKKGG